MKRNSIFFCILFAITANTFTTAKAQVNVNDSLALVDLYNSTDGPNWSAHYNWLTTAPVSTWFGVFVGSTNRVVKISLGGNNLTGPIPASIGNLTSLNSLYLLFNNLNGALPVSIGNLTAAIDIDLSSNKLTDSIPSSIGNLSSLQSLNLQDNQLTGSIPAAITNLTNLTLLYISYNQLSGAIPATFGNLVNLQDVDLRDNGLSGTIPASIGNLKELNYLYLNINQLSGAIPASIGNLKKLSYLYLSTNQLSGAIPASIGNLKRLKFLILSTNRLSGTIPASFSKLLASYIDVSYNLLIQDNNIQFSMYKRSSTAGSVSYNLLTFNGLEFIASKFHKISYAPQNTILSIHQRSNSLAVYAGGKLHNNTYKWFKVGSVNATTILGDSTFTPSTSGEYYAMVTNAIATQLTLYSDTINYTMPLQSNATFLTENTAQIKSADGKLLVFPNPVKDVIHVQINGNAIITFTNSAGKVLLTKTITNSGAINVSSYANGMYYLQNKTSGENQKIIIIH